LAPLRPNLVASPAARLPELKSARRNRESSRSIAPPHRSIF
jgi:hypothetical protein